MNHRGYLFFTTHDGDELDAVFIPEEAWVIPFLHKASNTKEMEETNNKIDQWKEQNPDHLRWDTQTRCFIVWPFNDVTILGTFYHLIY